VPRGPDGVSTTLVLTTHFMDEAETLASRIGIMVKGQLTCLGTPQHLKSAYSSSYVLSYVPTDRQCPALVSVRVYL
jgi:ATP-binding cassette subfamily A (ABC1) protein 3